MEGIEHSSSKLQTNGETHQSEQEQQLGLGFPKPSPIPDSNLCPILVSNDDEIKQIISEELQNLTFKDSVNEEDYGRDFEQARHGEGKLNHAIDGEDHQLALKQASKVIQDESSNQAIDEAITENHARSDKDMKNKEPSDEKSDHKEDVKATSESEPETCPVLEENEDEKTANEVKENGQMSNEVNENGKASNEETKDKELNECICDKNGNNRGEIVNEEDNDKIRVKVEQGIDNYENNCSEYENEKVNVRIEVKEEQEIDKYEDERSENEQDEGYIEYDNEEKDSAGMAGSKDGTYRRYHFPLRPDAEDCSYYMRTGTCKFGSNCKFNHPLGRRNQAAKETFEHKEENSDRVGLTECKYYLTSGGCKYGKSCRYNHSRGKSAVAPIVEFNFLGLPIRPGEKECPYYMRNGSCKYGSNCRFNHPDPTGVSPLSGYGNTSVQVSKDNISSWSSPKMLNETAPFVPMIYPPTPGVPPPNPEWNEYQAPVYPNSERSLPTPPAFSMNIPASDANFYTHHQQEMLVEEFPERPGQPECSYFMKTGDCKYRSGCKFHHPKNRNPKASSLTLSDKGLPLRPEQNICTHYIRFGICKFGPACRYHHPVNYENSASVAGSGPGQPSPQYGNSAASDGQWKRE